MNDRRHRAALEKKIKTAVKSDKARIEVGHLSKFGLLEMSRQRIRASLSSQSTIKCPQCQGLGLIKNPELVALEALRKIQSAIVVGKVRVVKARLAPAAALFLLNNKKGDLFHLESTFQSQILILADGRLRPDEYDFEMETTKQIREIDSGRQDEKKSLNRPNDKSHGAPSADSGQRNRTDDRGGRGKRLRVVRRNRGRGAPSHQPNPVKGGGAS
jgi:ribonuclease E